LADSQDYDGILRLVRDRSLEVDHRASFWFPKLFAEVWGLVPKSDQIHSHVERNPNAFTRAEAEAVNAVYRPERTLQQLFAKDNERFRRAVEQTGSRLTATNPIAALVQQYERELDLQAAAAELGFRLAELSDLLKRSPDLARVLGPLRIPGGTVQRRVLLAAFPDLVRELGLGTYLPPASAQQR
jgi:hypothetical protein